MDKPTDLTAASDGDDALEYDAASWVAEELRLTAMTDRTPGWTKPEQTKLRWYHYIVIGIAVVVGGLSALMMGAVIFFGLIAGW